MISLLLIMKFHVLRSASALALAALLTACGGGQADQPAQIAAAMQSGSGAQLAVQSGSAAQVAVQPGSGTQVTAQVASNTPAPDCAADGCKRLRIIDGNAEAYRYDAMRRAAAAPGNT
jgi:hypothetical protein